MELKVNCNVSPLAAKANPLDKKQAQHLYHRLGFSASEAEINAIVGQKCQPRGR